MFRGLRANNTPCQAPLCPKRRPLRPQPPVFTVFRRGGLHCGHHTTSNRDLTATKRGNCTTRGSDTPATRQRRASCSAKPPTATGMEGAGGTAGPGRTTSRRAEHTPAHPAPQVWRAPEGPEGTGGLRGAAPNDVRPPSLAGGRALRRPQHPWGHKQTSNNQRHTATRSVL